MAQYVWTGVKPHIRMKPMAKPEVISRGQMFEPTEEELSSFADLMELYMSPEELAFQEEMRQEAESQEAESQEAEIQE